MSEAPGTMPLAVVIPLIIFVVLAAVFAVLLRRAGRLLAETREAEGFRRGTVDILARADVSIGGVVERIDAVRRHQVDAEAIGDNIAAALDAVVRYADEARALRAPVGSSHRQDALVGELERAERALEMVEHGRGIITDVRRGDLDSEAQTSIKRGYLNLIHAREALTRLGAEVSAADSEPGPGLFGRRGSA